jgi:hypothetical protein
MNILTYKTGFADGYAGNKPKIPLSFPTAYAQGYDAGVNRWEYDQWVIQ